MKTASLLLLFALIVAGVGFGHAALPTELPPAKGAVAPEKGGDLSPAAQTAEGAQSPSELGPEKRVVPQISVPLKRGKDEVSDKPSAPANIAKGSVEDSAARCRAKSSKSERAACQAGTANPAKPPSTEKPK